MLVLSRKETEQIQIGEQVTVTVVRLSAGRVMIGIDAPKEIKVLRGELNQDEPQRPKAEDAAA